MKLNCSLSKVSLEGTSDKKEHRFFPKKVPTPSKNSRFGRKGTHVRLVEGRRRHVWLLTLTTYATVGDCCLLRVQRTRGLFACVKPSLEVQLREK